MIYSLGDYDPSNELVHLRVIRYGLASHNCWWFAAVAIGTLQVIGSDWTIKPSKDWAKKAVQALGKSTRDSTQKVTTIFANRWHSGIMPPIPITNDSAWEAGPTYQVSVLCWDIKRHSSDSDLFLPCPIAAIRTSISAIKPTISISYRPPISSLTFTPLKAYARGTGASKVSPTESSSRPTLDFDQPYFSNDPQRPALCSTI